jgi:hypothetical protein
MDLGARLDAGDKVGKSDTPPGKQTSIPGLSADSVIVITTELLKASMRYILSRMRGFVTNNKGFWIG